MTTQERLEAIASYLPYKIKCHGMGEWVEGTEYNDKPTPKMFRIVGIVKDSNEEYYAQCEEDNGDISDVYIVEDLFPILRPLSDLSKPCLEDGKVPIVELAKIVELLEPVSYNEMTDFNGVVRGVCAKDKFNNQWLMFDFKEGFSMWHKPHGCPDHVLTLLDHQLQLFQQLYKWHFWLGDQSEFGKSIIDINTIKTE